MSKRPNTTASIQHLAGVEDIDGTMITSGVTVIGTSAEEPRVLERPEASQLSAPLGSRTGQLTAAPVKKKAVKRSGTVGHSVLDYLPRLTGAPFIISAHVIAAGVYLYLVGLT
ncbi:MAG: hypothetical protein P8N50_13540 [Actinomycetota bacterium]|jgi:hypothetical protein|nr:hypothetical protein [Actinomycetota bacterium]